MKITKTQLKQIIQEELSEIYVDKADPGFQKWLAQQKPTALEKELEARPSLERRVDNIERQLEEIIRRLGGGSPSGTTQVELEEQK